MKHLKNFAKFEAVIIPPKLEGDDDIRSFESLVRYGQKNDFDVVEYNEFYESIGDGDKKTAPPRFGVPFFALFHPIRKKAMFVVTDKNVCRFMPMKQIVDDIIGHERVHAEQSRRKGEIEYALPSPLNRGEYFSNKEEIMAFAWTIANEISKVGYLDISLNQLNNETFKGQAAQIWNDIKKHCSEDVIKRYRKYIYMYLQEMFPNDAENIHTKISKR